MLFSINFLQNHPSFRINRNIYYFLLKIKDVRSNARFDLKYFNDGFRNKVDNTDKLKLRLKEFFNKFKALDVNDRTTVIKAYQSSQQIPSLLSDIRIDGNELKLESLPPSIRGACARLFVYLYKTTLKTYKEKHYRQLYADLQSKICPFCALEKLNSPDLYNQDYDHILYKGDYPFAAVNMRNLVPMGSDCNQKYKTITDVLYDEAGTRRLFLDPYVTSIDVRFSLDGSILPIGGKHKGIWKVAIVPDNDHTRTWNEVFKIEERCVKNELEPFFDTWIGFFKKQLKKKGILWNEAQVKDEMKKAGETYVESDLDVSCLIKGALFTFLSSLKEDAFFNSILLELNS